MRFQLATTLVALLTTTVLAQDAGVSSIVSQVDSIKSELYALTTATGSDVSAQATSLGGVLLSLIASISTNSDWPAASSILISQAATDSANLSSIKSSLSASESSKSTSTSKSTGSAQSSKSGSAAGATSSGLAPMVTAGISGMMAMGILGAAVLL